MSTQNRKACRQGRRCDLRSLGEAIHCLVHHSDLDARQIAERLGVRYGYLLDAANPDREDTQFQARLVVPLTVLTGRYDLMDYLEREVGRVAFAVPQSPAGEHADLFTALAEAMRELGEDAERLRLAVDDGTITSDEAEAFEHEADETIAAIARMKAIVVGKVRRLTVRKPA